MSKKTTPAFPNLSPNSSGPHIANRDGMTLRQWYAGQALAGIMANPTHDDAHETAIAILAVGVADALIAELEIE